MNEATGFYCFKCGADQDLVSPSMLPRSCPYCSNKAITAMVFRGDSMSIAEEIVKAKSQGYSANILDFEMHKRMQEFEAAAKEAELEAKASEIPKLVYAAAKEGKSECSVYSLSHYQYETSESKLVVWGFPKEYFDFLRVKGLNVRVEQKTVGEKYPMKFCDIVLRF